MFICLEIIYYSPKLISTNIKTTKADIFVFVIIICFATAGIIMYNSSIKIRLFFSQAEGMHAGSFGDSGKTGSKR